MDLETVTLRLSRLTKVHQYGTVALISRGFNLAVLQQMLCCRMIAIELIFPATPSVWRGQSDLMFQFVSPESILSDKSICQLSKYYGLQPSAGLG